MLKTVTSSSVQVKILAMPEKAFRSSRLLQFVLGLSMLLLVCSTFFLFHSVIIPFTPSVFKYIVVDSEYVYVKKDGDELTEHAVVEPVVVPSPPLSVVDTHETEKIPVERYKGTDVDERSDMSNESCNTKTALLRVYMYDMPPEYHFGLLEWKARPSGEWPDVSDPAKIPRYPGGLNLQHNIEYWLTLDLLSSNVKGVARPCSVIRVKNVSQADFIFVPFFSSLSYNRHSKVQGNERVSLDRKLQNQLVDFLRRRPEWRKSGGKDHIIIAHHPNSLFYCRKKLDSARFVLADFGRYEAKTANLEKDVISPYKHLVKTISTNASAPFELRPTLVYFQGAIYRKDGGSIRQELFYLLKDEKDVHFAFGNAQRSGIREASQGMGTSKFCLNIAGDTPSSNRLFDAIACHCVPVIISDDIELPYEDVLNYSEFSIFVWASDAVKDGFLLNLLRGIQRKEWTKMWEKLKEVAHHFDYQYPSKPGDAVDMIWQAFARKKATTKIHQKERVYRMP